jgi:hypothetical protein
MTFDEILPKLLEENYAIRRSEWAPGNFLTIARSYAHTFIVAKPSNPEGEPYLYGRVAVQAEGKYVIKENGEYRFLTDFELEQLSHYSNTDWEIYRKEFYPSTNKEPTNDSTRPSI